MAFVRVRPLEVNTAFRNPDKGWLPYLFTPLSNPASTQITAYASSIYTNYVPWSSLETSEGVYDWTIVDSIITTWKATGRKVRFGIAGPKEPAKFGGVEGFPAWVRALPGGGYFEPTTPDIWQPDYRNATFQTMFTNLLNAFATRYYDSTLGAGENDWREWMPAFDISIYGQFGEWHSTEFPWADVTEQRTTLRTLIDIYFSAFNAARGSDPLPQFVMNAAGQNADGFDFPISDPFDSLGVQYAIETKGAHMVRRNFGLNLGLSLWDDEPPYMAARLPTRSLEGEWGPTHGNMWWFKNASTPFVYTEDAIDDALARGVSHMGWHISSQTIACATIPAGIDTAEAPVVTTCTAYGGANSGNATVSSPLDAKLYPGTAETLRDYMQRRMGYRFHVSYHHHPPSVVAGGTFRLTQRWYQRAVAKLYHQHYLRARLVGVTTITMDRDTSSFNAHLWREVGACGPRLIVSTFTVPGGTAAGWYELQFAVVDAAGNPAMNIANVGKITAGLADPVNDYSWYLVGNIQIT